MKYARILLAVASEVWAMHPEKLEAMMDFLRLQAEGIKFSAEEIEARITQAQEREIAKADGPVGIVPIHGVISNRMNMLGSISGGTTVDGISAAFEAAVRDTKVKAVIGDINSPGGAVAGISELSAQIFAARGIKPLIAHVNAQAASAAYWLASAFDEVVVTPSGELGSIGVMTVHDDVSAALEKLGVKKTLIGAPENKGEGAPFLPLAEETKAYMQSRVAALYDVFVRDLARNRNTTLTSVKENFGKGRMFFAEQAINQGMADKVATLEQTLQRFGASLYATPAPKKRALAPKRERAALSL